jgi:hypothetical protein
MMAQESLNRIWLMCSIEVGPRSFLPEAKSKALDWDYLLLARLQSVVVASWWLNQKRLTVVN